MTTTEMECICELQNIVMGLQHRIAKLEERDKQDTDFWRKKIEEQAIREGLRLKEVKGQ